MPARCLIEGFDEREILIRAVHFVHVRRFTFEYSLVGCSVEFVLTEILIRMVRYGVYEFMEDIRESRMPERITPSSHLRHCVSSSASIEGRAG
jgi:hypothetical protein